MEPYTKRPPMLEDKRRVVDVASTVRSTTALAPGSCKSDTTVHVTVQWYRLLNTVAEATVLQNVVVCRAQHSRFSLKGQFCKIKIFLKSYQSIGLG
jgi:hypothetical protein